MHQMKRICTAFFSLFLMLASTGAAYSQDYVPTPVEISTTLVAKDNKIYYEHLVLERQTLYSICKAYGADLDDVTYINFDDVKDGLKAGTKLLIPYGGSYRNENGEAASGTVTVTETVTAETPRACKEAGLVDDSVAFNSYMCANGYDRRLNVGNHEIPVGADNETICKKLCGME